jgi:hypothetical protein
VARDKSSIEAAELELRAAQRQVREERTKFLTGRELPPDEPPLCSFCGAGHNNVRFLIESGSSGDAHICDECVAAFHSVNSNKK